MSLQLPRLRVLFEGGKRRVRASKGGAIAPVEARRLARLDRPYRRFSPGHRFVPLGRGRWTVGRGGDGGVVWRIGSFDSLPRDVHPAWLWTQEHWFETRMEPLETMPTALGLRACLARATPVGRTYARTATLLAGVIAAHRRGQPVALIVPTRVLMSPDDPVRWFMHCVLATMPRTHALRLRISSREADPGPEDWDIVATDQSFPGFDEVSEHRPGSWEGDAVAAFIRDRLARDDPEAIEATAASPRPEGDDPWAAAVDRHLRDRSDIHTTDAPDAPERAAEAVSFRLRSGRPVDETLPAQLASLSRQSADVRAWKALAARTEAERSRVVQGWLEHVDPEEIDPAVLAAVAQVRPAGSHTAAWCRLLAEWSRHTDRPAAIPGLLQPALLADEVDAPLRAASFTTWVRGAIEAGDVDRARACFDGRVAERLALDGQARTLTYAWLSLPEPARRAPELQRLLELAGIARDGDESIVALYQSLRGGQAELLDLLLGSWAARCAEESRPGPAALVQTLAAAERLAWARGVVRPDPLPEVLLELLDPITGGVHALDVWRTAEQAWAEQHEASPRDRLIWLTAAATTGAEMVEQLARERVHDAVEQARFPDAELVVAGSALAALPESSTVWMWLAATASEPGQFDEGTLDATVVSFCENPPVGPALRECTVRCAERLGTASHWEPLDHARWLVRLCLAPHPDELPLRLCRALMRGAGDGDGGTARVAAIASAMVGLPSDHPALRTFLQDVLPAARPAGDPEGILDHLPMEGIAATVRTQVYEALGLPC